MSELRYMRFFESAPRDGQAILVHREIAPSDDDPHYIVVRWSEYDECWVMQHSGEGVLLNSDNAGTVHWQPVLLIP